VCNEVLLYVVLFAKPLNINKTVLLSSSLTTLNAVLVFGLKDFSDRLKTVPLVVVNCSFS